MTKHPFSFKRNMASIDSNDKGLARPLDEVLADCDRALELEYEHTDPSRHADLDVFIENSKPLFLACFFLD
jgi:hypothetical protein